MHLYLCVPLLDILYKEMINIPESLDWLITAVTGDPWMHRTTCLTIPSCRFLLLARPLSDMELVERSSHLRQGYHELLISGDSDQVPVTVSPGDRKLCLRTKGGEQSGQLALEEGEAGADIGVQHKPSHLSVLLLRALGQEHFVGHSVCHSPLSVSPP